MTRDVWEKAKKLAGLEFTLGKLETLEAPKAIVKNQEDIIQRQINAILSDPKNEQILAALESAKKFVHQADRREKAVKTETPIGAFEDLLLNWFAQIADRIPGAPSRKFAKKLGLDDDALNTWEQLTAVIKQLPRTKQEQIVDALMGLLVIIKVDLIYASLPQVPKLPEGLED